MPDTINFGTAAYKNAVTGLIITSIKFGRVMTWTEVPSSNIFCVTFTFTGLFSTVFPSRKAKGVAVTFSVV